MAKIVWRCRYCEECWLRQWNSKFLKGEESLLNKAETFNLLSFKLLIIEDVVEAANQEESSAFQRIEIAAKRICLRLERSNSIYDLEHIQSICPTSCDVERLFSKAKHLLSSVRNRTNPRCFEARLFLSKMKFCGWTSMTMIILRSLPIKVSYWWRRCFAKNNQGDLYFNSSRMMSSQKLLMLLAPQKLWKLCAYKLWWKFWLIIIC